MFAPKGLNFDAHTRQYQARSVERLRFKLLGKGLILFVFGLSGCVWFRIVGHRCGLGFKA